ncbi:MAG TPA: hypothetical protein VIO84_03095 [Candidatus Dormibacteraeota bacterium]
MIRWSERLGVPRVALLAVAALLALALVAFVRAVAAGDSFHGGSWAAAGALLGMGALGLLYAWRLGVSGPPD